MGPFDDDPLQRTDAHLRHGGWTDTWFAEHGTVFSIAIEPRVHVELTAFADDGSRPPW